MACRSLSKYSSRLMPAARTAAAHIGDKPCMRRRLLCPMPPAPFFELNYIHVSLPGDSISMGRSLAGFTHIVSEDRRSHHYCAVLQGRRRAFIAALKRRAPSEMSFILTGRKTHGFCHDGGRWRRRVDAARIMRLPAAADIDILLATAYRQARRHRDDAAHLLGHDNILLAATPFDFNF